MKPRPEPVVLPGRRASSRPGVPMRLRPFLLPYACLIAVGAAVGFWLWPESGQE